jgi:hypothetical protein
VCSSDLAIFSAYTNGINSSTVVNSGTVEAIDAIAGVYAIAGNGASLNAASFSYAHTGSLNDVTSGTNATGPPPTPCPNYLCMAGTGYDGPTGNGTPNGIGAF